MKVVLLITALIVAVSAKDFAPLSDEIVEFVNKLETTWKAEKTKFHEWNLESFKKTLGVPLSSMGVPSKLPKYVHEKIENIPG